MKYSIEGDPFPVVICDVDEGESLICNGGAMSWMSDNMKMNTTTGGGIGKMLGRVLSHEDAFFDSYTAEGGPGIIAFSSAFPGVIHQLDISSDNEMIIEKSAFLAATPDVELSVFFQKKFGTGVFAGEGFIMQKLSGSGTAFVEFCGYVKEYDLAEGQQMIFNTGYLAAMTSSCKIDIKNVPGVKNALFGGEGLFNTVVTGPGKVWLQTMPLSQLANDIIPFLPSGSHSG